MIIWRDTQGRGGVRIPACLAGCADVHRRQTDSGDLVSACEPLLLADYPAAKWQALDDGWQVALVGEPEIERLARKRQDIAPITVRDRKGREWVAPAVIAPDGQIALALPWGRKDGVLARVPDDEQASIIAAAQAARAEIEANRLAQAPVEAVFSWVAVLVASLYHLDAPTLIALGLLDDTLCVAISLASAGFIPPRADGG